MQSSLQQFSPSLMWQFGEETAYAPPASRTGSAAAVRSRVLEDEFNKRRVKISGLDKESDALMTVHQKAIAAKTMTTAAFTCTTSSRKERPLFGRARDEA